MFGTPLVGVTAFAFSLPRRPEAKEVCRSGKVDGIVYAGENSEILDRRAGLFAARERRSENPPAEG